jgi:hypothetical protein
LEMAKVLLGAFAEEEEGGLEGKLREFVDDLFLLLDLDLQEVPPELGRTNACFQGLDFRGPDVVKGGGDGLEHVEAEGRGGGVEEVADNADGVGVIGEDGNVVKVGEEEEVAMAFEGALKVFERLSDREREEERGEGIALPKAGGGERVGVLSISSNDRGRLGIRKSGRSEELGSMSPEGSGSVRSRGLVEGVGKSRVWRKA